MGVKIDVHLKLLFKRRCIFTTTWIVHCGHNVGIIQERDFLLRMVGKTSDRLTCAQTKMCGKFCGQAHISTTKTVNSLPVIAYYKQ